jgi:hypothetical protein
MVITVGQVLRPLIFLYSGGLYIGKYPPGVGISANVVWGKNMKRQRKKVKKCIKRRMGQDKEKVGSKRVK